MLDLKSILSKKEDAGFEAKSAKNGLPKSIWETYSAFANTFGGVIVLGMEENDAHTLVPVGVKHTEQMKADIWNTLNNRQKISANILLEEQVYVTDYDGKDIIVIEVPRADRRDRPVYVGTDMFKGSFKRNFGGDYHCKEEEITAMLRDRSAESADGRIIDNLSVSDLNSDSVKSYRTLFANLKPYHSWTKISNTDFLVRIGAARKGERTEVHPTLAGLIFFGDFITIMNELPDYFLDYREKMSGNRRWSDRVCSGDGDWSGNVFDFYFKIIDRLTSDVKRPFKLDENLMRVDETPVHTGLREVLANALIHADYYGRCGIVVNKEFGKITVSNPGCFRIGLDAAIAGGISDARNGRLFNMFSLIDVGERSGSGLCDIYSTWEHCGFKRPEIIESVDPDRTSVILETEVDGKKGLDTVGREKNQKHDKDDDRNDDRNDRNNDRNDRNNDRSSDRNARNADGTENRLTASEARVFEILKKDSALSAAQVAQLTGLSAATVNRAYKSLKEQGYLERKGKTKGVWKILK